MRKISLAATVALVVAVASVTLASASASSQGTHVSDKQSTQVIHLVAKRIQDTDIDLGVEGESLGDQIVFSENLFHRGKKIGRSGGVVASADQLAAAWSDRVAQVLRNQGIRT